MTYDEHEHETWAHAENVWWAEVKVRGALKLAEDSAREATARLDDAISVLAAARAKAEEAMVEADAYLSAYESLSTFVGAAVDDERLLLDAARTIDSVIERARAEIAKRKK